MLGAGGHDPHSINGAQYHASDVYTATQASRHLLHTKQCHYSLFSMPIDWAPISSFQSILDGSYIWILEREKAEKLLGYFPP